MDEQPDAPDALDLVCVRVTMAGHPGYCSGFLVARDLDAHDHRATDTVITCAHYLRGTNLGDTTVRVHGHNPDGSPLDLPAQAARVQRFGDVAVLRLRRPAPPRELIAVGRGCLLGARTVTCGFGGDARRPQRRYGRGVLPMPASIARDLGAWVLGGTMIVNSPPAVHGDSGGPVSAAGRILGAQSLILDPGGVNLRVATVTHLGWHRGWLRRAIGELTKDDTERDRDPVARD